MYSFNKLTETVGAWLGSQLQKCNAQTFGLEDENCYEKLVTCLPAKFRWKT